MLGLTFKFAFDLFTQPVEQSLGMVKGKPLDVAETSRQGLALLTRVIMLLLMCIVASLIANRGVKMYSSRADGFLAAREEKERAAKSDA